MSEQAPKFAKHKRIENKRQTPVQYLCIEAREKRNNTKFMSKAKRSARKVLCRFYLKSITVAMGRMNII